MDPEESTAVRELLDRDEISSLLVKFARALDEKDWDGYANLYAEEGVFRRPNGCHRGRAGLAEFVKEDLGHYVATHHVTGNHDIEVAGDTATARSLLQAYHVRSEDPSDFWAVGGWYDTDLRRTEDGWRITSAEPKPVWLLDTGRTGKDRSGPADQLLADISGVIGAGSSQEPM